MKEITLSLDGRKTRILVGRGILASAGGLLAESMPSGKCAIITNPTVKRRYGDELSSSLDDAGIRHSFIEIADAETAKSMAVAGEVCTWLSGEGFDRSSGIISLGGGVVGDLAGFVAATYMRGVDLAHIPTTLMAQVDSSVGGKTGVNLPSGKNLVGAFHQPKLVVSDVSTLATLSDREFRSGLAEVVKYAMISGPAFFTNLERNMDAILRRDPEALESVVAECAAIKARMVEEDERDVGIRRRLNLGHTLGHALEAATEYKTYLHGEAISVGMVFAVRVSASKGLVPDGEIGRLTEVLTRAGLPTRLDPKLDCLTLMRFMAADKKARGGRMAMVLPTGIGLAEVVEDIDSKLALETLMEMQT